MSAIFTDCRFYYRHERHDAALSVCSVGYETTHNAYHWGPGARAYYILQHVVSGTGTLCQQGKTFPLRPGDTFVTFPQQQETLESHSANWQYLWIGFSGSEAAMLLRKLGFSEDSPVLYIGNDETIREIHENIYKVRGPRLSDSVAMTGHLYLLFSHLMTKMRLDDPSEDSDELQAVLTYIDAHLMERCTVEELCRFANISRSYLYRIFIRNIGVSPIRYVMDIKISRSCYLLANTKMSIGEVAYAMGYTDPLYYSRVFKSIMGVTPTEFRSVSAEEKNSAAPE